MPCCGKQDKSRVLVVGGSFSGLFTGRDLKKKFDVTIVDAKEYFEYTPGILRAYVKPAHFDALTFTLQPVIERKMGVKFIWGEVLSLSADHTAVVKPMFTERTETLKFEYCMICAGCNFGRFEPNGESLWFPVIHAKGREISGWKHIDERFLEGRRRRILEEYHHLNEANSHHANVLVVGAGFIGVEWATELDHFFPNLDTTIIDMLPNCLGPLPISAAQYCSEYMNASDIHEFYKVPYDYNSHSMWVDIGLPDKVPKDVIYVCVGVKSSNFFMPPETLVPEGRPGGPGWIYMNEYLQVTTQPPNRPPPPEKGEPAAKVKEVLSGDVWGGGDFFAVGDCNYGCIGRKDDWDKNEGLPPIPKISYPGEEQALHAVKSIKRLDQKKQGKKKALYKTWWPWGSGMFATSLGPNDACFVLAANHNFGSGYMVNWWWFAATQKELIETTKIDECKDNWIGILIWHFVHHTPMHLFGKGKLFP